MICPNCGAIIEENSRFCGNCGAAVSQPVPNAAWNSNFNANYNRINGTAYTIVSALFIFLGIIWGVLALTNATQINKLQDMGEFELAQKKAKTCRILWVVAIVVNGLMMIGYLAQNGVI